MSKHITITNNSTTLIVKYSSPYNQTYLYNKAETNLHYKIGNPYISLIAQSQSRARPQTLRIYFADVSSPATATIDDLYAVLSAYLNVPMDSIRSGIAAVGVGSTTIAFSSALSAATYTVILFEPDGTGSVITAHTVNGFTVNSLSAGNINYVAILS